MLRFASSPTGDMHISHLRIAILSYLLAQQRKERFGIRIDDHNKAETIEGKDTEIMQILEKFALKHDSVFHQSEHLHMHQTLAIKLLKENKAFVCTCTEEENKSCLGECEEKNKTLHAKFTENKTPFVLRLKKPNTDIRFYDNLQGEVVTSVDKIDTFVILDKEGNPTVDFASACDDMLSGITMHISEDTQQLNTAKQIYIQHQLGFDDKIAYTHIPSISNCKNTATVHWFLEQGFIPDALINYLLFIDNKDVPKKVFTLPDAISWFTIKSISSHTAVFDMDTLRDINRKHLRNMDNKQLSSLFGFADAEVGKLVKLYSEEASTINELALKIRPIFAPKNFEETWADEMKILQKIIADAPMIDDFNKFTSYLMKKSGLKEEALTKPLRLLLTGALHGPELSDIYPLIKPYLLEVAS